MRKLQDTLRVFFILGLVVLPFKAQAEAEQIYVEWLDLDYMESNPMLGWIEDVKETIADTSPLIGQFLLPEDSVSGMDEDKLTYEDENPSSQS